MASVSGRGDSHHPDGDHWMNIRIPRPLSAARALVRGEFGGRDTPRARLMAVLLMEAFGLEDYTPGEFIDSTRELESLGLLTDLIERRS